jgi:hypothetical protein
MVIATCFGPRSVRMNTGLSGFPPGWFDHAQNYPDEPAIIGLLELQIQQISTVDPGCEVDFIIINNDVGSSKGNRYLKSLDGKSTPYGRIMTQSRGNFGRAFGAYSYAFDLYRDAYDFFLFTEDDVLINYRHYYSLGLELLAVHDYAAFLAYIGLSSRGIGQGTGAPFFHAHGSVGLASSKVLASLYERYGKLPHAGYSESQDYNSIITKGEIAFSNGIYLLGFPLIEFPPDLKLYNFAYDFERGITLPKYC